MYGPAAEALPPPPPRSPGPGAWGMTVRLLFASFPVWSLGLLSWVPSLRFAVLRGRRLDWAVFGLSVALTACYVVLLFVVPADDPEGESTASLFAGFYIIALIVGSVVHAVLGDRFDRLPRPPAFGPAPAVPPPGHAHTHGYGYPPVPYATDATRPPAGAAPSSSDRMRQVASELDELDELLRKRGNGR